MAQPVFIISHLFEPSVNEVIKHLDRMGTPWKRLNCEEFPLLIRGCAQLGDGGNAAGFSNGHGDWPLDDVRSVWFRRLTLPVLPKALRSYDRSFIQSEVSAFYDGLFDAACGLWVNDRAAERRAANKIRQLRAAQLIGLRIPQTLVTNDPEKVRAFHAESGGRVIFKPVSGFAPRSADFSQDAQGRFSAWGEVCVDDMPQSAELEIVFAQILDDAKLDKIETLNLSPAIFQEFIEKAADIRVTIVGEEIFACRIYSQELEQTRVDFRKMALLDAASELKHELFDLPKDMETKLRRFMAHFGLAFGCIDLVETAAGEMIFLEVNPAGQWLWIEQMTGAPISAQLALLLSEAKGPDAMAPDPKAHASPPGPSV